jgi:hypothetical protein
MMVVVWWLLKLLTMGALLSLTLSLQDKDSVSYFHFKIDEKNIIYALYVWYALWNVKNDDNEDDEGLIKSRLSTSCGCKDWSVIQLH